MERGGFRGLIGSGDSRNTHTHTLTPPLPLNPLSFIMKEEEVWSEQQKKKKNKPGETERRRRRE